MMKATTKTPTKNIVNSNTDVPKIESGISIPPLRGRPNKWQKLFEKMKKGDSFIVPGKKHNVMTLYQNAKRMKIKITVRKTDKGYRVWKI